MKSGKLSCPAAAGKGAGSTTIHGHLLSPSLPVPPNPVPGSGGGSKAVGWHKRKA